MGAVGVTALVLHEDRFFDSDAEVRRVARELYAQTKALPIISPHGHVDARLLAEDAPFAEPSALMVAPDHYILRMLYSRGVRLEALGVPARDGTPVETDPRAVWRLFASHYHLFRGTPTGVWLDHQLSEVFGVRVRLSAATATDHAVEQPATALLDGGEAERIFRRGLSGVANDDDQRRFEATLLMEMARMSTEDGLVMQLHAGSLRDHNTPLARRFGPDRGGDIPVATEFTRNLRPLLQAYGNDPRLTLILFTLDESTYSRELAPLAGHYPTVRLGAPWWFHDSIEGMARFREQTTETAGIYNTVGFTDDTRAFCSIPARHDMSRRVDANWLARLVARHIVSMGDAREMARALAYDLPREAYRLG
jgi:glucuronate isomerase